MSQNLSASTFFRIGSRVLAAGGVTALLVIFLVAMRWFSETAMPDQTIREVQVVPPIAPIALPAPLSPPTKNVAELLSSLPPPPKLPRLDLQIEQTAPPVRAVVNEQMNLAMQTADFELEVDSVAVSAPTRKRRSNTKRNSLKMAKKTPAPSTKPAPKVKPKRTTYSAGELDVKPRLTNRPSATYPAAQLRKGVRQGKVLLEVSISPSGRCSVRRVIASSHGDFSAMARSFASKARFSTPKKNGRAVTAIYRWPLILKP